MKTFIHTDVILEGLYICPDYELCQRSHRHMRLCGHRIPHRSILNVLCATAPYYYPEPYPICCELMEHKNQLGLSEEDCRIKLCRPATSYDKRTTEGYRRIQHWGE